jgi:hypothetical protein
MARSRRSGKPTGLAIVPEYTDVDADAFTILPDGRKVRKTVFGLTEEQVGRIRAGYVCVKCLEDHDVAFPDECAVCRFPMRDKQTEEFTKDYRGNIRFGPSTTIDEEYAIAEETIQREAYEKATRLGLILPKPSIVVPKSL